MKILVTVDDEFITLKNLISIRLDIGEKNSENTLAYSLMAEDINGEEIYLGGYLDLFTANLVLDEIMFWSVDPDNPIYTIPYVDDFNEDVAPEVFKPQYNDKELINKLYQSSTFGAECIKTQDGSLLFLNNIISLRSYALNDTDYEFLSIEEKERMRKKFKLRPTINTIIVAKSIRGQEILVGKFVEDNAHYVLNDIYIRRILYFTDN